MARHKEVVVNKCHICGEPMIVEYPMNMEIFSGRAGWNMSFYPKINMCKNCSDNLLEYMEKWFKHCNKTNECKKFNLKG